MSAARVEKPEEDFGAAFAEPTTDTTKKVETTDVVDPNAKKDGADPGTKEVKTDVVDPGKQSAGTVVDDKSKTDPPAGDAAKSESQVQDVNHWRGKANWSEGHRAREKARADAAEAKAKQLEADLAEAKKSGPAKAPEAATTTTDLDPLKRIEEEMPETAGATREAIKQATDALRKEIGGRALTAEEVEAIVKKALAPTTDALASDAYAKHWGEIRSAHADVDEWTKDGSPFFQWKDSLPEEEQDMLNRVLEGGTATQVNRALTRFKTATGRAQPAAADDKKDDKSGKVADGKIDNAALAVKTKAGTPMPEGEKDPNDFGAAFRSDG